MNVCITLVVLIDMLGTPLTHGHTTHRHNVEKKKKKVKFWLFFYILLFLLKQQKNETLPTLTRHI